MNARTYPSSRLCIACYGTRGIVCMMVSLLFVDLANEELVQLHLRRFAVPGLVKCRRRVTPYRDRKTRL